MDAAVMIGERLRRDANPAGDAGAAFTKALLQQLFTRHHAENHKDQEQEKEYPEQEFCDGGGGRSDAGEAERPGDECDQEKY
jgi:hypothetical protein